ncbi:hypothetical protein MAJ_10797, partial [Metarhizium majus ARSEF 297]
MALVFYVTNYTMKAEDPVWKRVAAAAELLPVVSASRGPAAKGGEDIGDNGATDGAAGNRTRWRHLRQESGIAVGDDPVDDLIVVEEAGERISYVEAYEHRGGVLGSLCLYDYTSLIKLRRTDKDETAAS